CIEFNGASFPQQGVCNRLDIPIASSKLLGKSQSSLEGNSLG
ncbi:hypothetical protein A2U01_0083272, partial [Trifolium medium]|nr:hypothetical protein [Trifolium medium]